MRPKKIFQLFVGAGALQLIVPLAAAYAETKIEVDDRGLNIVQGLSVSGDGDSSEGATVHIELYDARVPENKEFIDALPAKKIALVLVRDRPESELIDGVENKPGTYEFQHVHNGQWTVQPTDNMAPLARPAHHKQTVAAGHDDGDHEE